jgi:hypothetical protein
MFLHGSRLKEILLFQPFKKPRRSTPSLLKSTLIRLANAVLLLRPLILVCAFKYFSPQTTNFETGRWESAIQHNEVRNWQKKQLNHRSRE